MKMITGWLGKNGYKAAESGIGFGMKQGGTSMEKHVSVFQQVVRVLPQHLRAAALAMPREVQGQAEELRLRAGYAMTVLFGERELVLEGALVSGQDLEQLLERASRTSVHAVLEQLREGFIGIEGGHRIGFCGTTITERGEVTFFKNISSAAIRIAREFPGIARSVVGELVEKGQLQSTLIAAPPGGGKTSLLRDLIRTVSEGECETGLRVGVVDPRGELGASVDGICQLELGRRTDLLNNCPKAVGIMMLLRTMNPQVIAVDEITQRGDMDAILEAAGCGVGLLATIHGRDRQELEQRDLYRDLLRTGVFRRLILIRGRGALRHYIVEVLT